MVPLALRFRDTTPDIDTIREHKTIISREGKVAWGWWKKNYEEYDLTALLHELHNRKTLQAYLIDTSNSQSFVATCVGYFSPADVDSNLVPSYYKHQISKTGGFFVLSDIEGVVYDSALGDALGEKTLLSKYVNAPKPAPRETIARQSTAKSCVLCLSDLHFGEDYAFLRRGEISAIGDTRKTLADCLFQDLERLGFSNDIAAVIVTGDFITKGNWNDAVRNEALEEFTHLSNRLGIDKTNIIAVPGNHDIVRSSTAQNQGTPYTTVDKQTDYSHETMFRTFVEKLADRSWKDPLNYTKRICLEEVDLDICVINSCVITNTNWTEYGYAGKFGIEAIDSLIDIKSERVHFRFLALHHHLLPVATVNTPNSSGVSLTLDASLILSAAQRAGVHVAIHGHQHKPKIVKYQDIALNGDQLKQPVFVVANGSSGVTNARLPGGERNTYSLFNLKKNGIKLWIRELRLDGVCGAEIYGAPLITQP